MQLHIFQYKQKRTVKIFEIFLPFNSVVWNENKREQKNVVIRSFGLHFEKENVNAGNLTRAETIDLVI